MHIRPPNLTVGQKIKKISKSETVDSGHLENQNKTVWPILVKFYTITHISSPEHTRHSKKLNLKKSKMTEGHHFDNC